MPEVGKVNIVLPVVLNVISEAFEIVVPVVVNPLAKSKLPPSVIVLPVLSIPVPPFAAGKTPETEDALILPIALVTKAVFAIVPSFELTTGVGV